MTPKVPPRSTASRVGIGLPVYNGERFLEAAIEAILAQTYEDFELVVVDNASTDRSVEIARDIASNDGRIRIELNETNLGAPRNFNRAFDITHGEYFKWAAHDDLLEPTYLERCISFLDAERDYVLCHSRVGVIGSEGKPLYDYDVNLPHVESSAPADRFGDLVLIRHACYDAFGVLRRSTLARTPRIGAYLSSDRCLLAELALHGRFRILPETLYLNREHGDRSVRIPNHQRARAWFDQGRGGRFIFPAWRLLGEYAAAIDRTPLSQADRRACRRVLVRWLLRNWRLLRGDLRIAAIDALRSRPSASASAKLDGSEGHK